MSSRRKLLEVCEHLREAGCFGWDTEFIQDRTYWPRLCLLQVATGDFEAAIDPFEVGELTPFWELIGRADVRTVVHAGAQDFQIAYDASGTVPRSVFDTQIAASFVGYGDSISYAGLLGRELGVRLSKHETMTDWSRRPLAGEQLEYALDDVRHLLPLQERLRARLEELGRLEWIEEEHRTYECEESFQRDPRRAWERLAKRKNLQGRTLAVLREIAAWRERTAAERDVPRNRVVGDDALVEIARRAPRDRRALEAIRSLHRRVMEQHAAEILRCVRAGLELPAAERPRASVLRSEDPARARLLDVLDLLVRVRARETGVARNVLATRRDLGRVVALHFGEGPPGEEPRILRGWRAQLVGHDLRKLLRGELVLGVDPAAGCPVIRQSPSPAPKGTAPGSAEGPARRPSRRRGA